MKATVSTWNGEYLESETREIPHFKELQRFTLHLNTHRSVDLWGKGLNMLIIVVDRSAYNVFVTERDGDHIYTLHNPLKSPLQVICGDVIKINRKMMLEVARYFMEHGNLNPAYFWEKINQKEMKGFPEINITEIQSEAEKQMM